MKTRPWHDYVHGSWETLVFAFTRLAFEDFSSLSLFLVPFPQIVFRNIRLKAPLSRVLLFSVQKSSHMGSQRPRSFFFVPHILLYFATFRLRFMIAGEPKIDCARSPFLRNDVVFACLKKCGKKYFSLSLCSPSAAVGIKKLSLNVCRIEKSLSLVRSIHLKRKEEKKKKISWHNIASENGRIRIFPHTPSFFLARRFVLFFFSALLVTRH